MPKLKTHKGMKKRFTVTASGKAVARAAGRGHILSSKTAKRKRQLRGDTILTGATALKVREGLAPIL